MRRSSNSIIVQNLSSHDYTVASIRPKFLNGSALNIVGFRPSWADPSPAAFSAHIQSLQNRSTSFERLEIDECITAYATPYLVDRKSVLVVVDKVRSKELAWSWQQQNHQPVFAAGSQTYGVSLLSLDITTTPGPRSHYNPHEWICDYVGGQLPCFAWSASIHSSDRTLHGRIMRYCLSERVDEACSLEILLPTMVVLLIMLGLQVASMLLLRIYSPDSLIMTLGDAITSFLDRGDVFKQPQNLPAKFDIVSSTQQTFEDEGLKPMYWTPQSRYYFQAAGPFRWAITTSLNLASLCLTAWFLSFSIAGLRSSRSTSDQSLLKILNGIGLGSVSAETLFSTRFSRSGSKNLITNSILANVPQVVISCLYLLYNNLFTSMLLSGEWSRFAHTRKGLRVSRPNGCQRCSYFLQLPFKYAVPLFCLFTALQYFVSQSFFLARVLVTDIYGFQRPERAITTVGYSPWAILISAILGVSLMLFMILMGLRKYKPGMPFVGSCSMAIAAACRTRIQAINTDVSSAEFDLSVVGDAHGKLSTRRLQWGSVCTTNMVTHCGFSDEEVLQCVPGILYPRSNHGD